MGKVKKGEYGSANTHADYRLKGKTVTINKTHWLQSRERSINSILFLKIHVNKKADGHCILRQGYLIIHPVLSTSVSILCCGFGFCV